MPREASGRSRARLAAGVVASAAIFAYALSDAPFVEVARLARARGAALGLALLPPVLTLSADAFAWAHLLGCWGHRPPLWRLWPARVATEAVALTVPGGTVLGEGFKPALLGRRFGVPAAHAVAASAAQRWWLMRAHAAFVVASGLFGYAHVEALSRALTGTSALVPALFVSALSPLAVSIGLEAACRRGGLAARLFGLLVRRLPGRWGAGVARRRGHFEATDGAFAAVASAPVARLGPAALALLGAWFLESFDSWVALRAVGAPLAYRQVIAVEGGLSLLRSLAFFAPAGLGVQDVGYLRCLELFGVSPAEAAAFVLVKRCKELAWAALGYALLAAQLRHAGRAVRPAEGAAEEAGEGKATGLAPAAPGAAGGRTPRPGPLGSAPPPARGEAGALFFDGRAPAAHSPRCHVVVRRRAEPRPGRPRAGVRVGLRRTL
jgi:hypothetical protein